jgi:glycosyltransferase involved in cell wall biosynthesis
LPLGTPDDIAAYRDVMGEAHCIRLPALFSSPGPSALFHLAAAGDAAARAGAAALLLPAANRRVTVRSPIPTVAVVHDLAQLRVRRKYDPLRVGYFRHLVVPALARADRLVAVSETTRKDVTQALGVPEEQVAVVPNGVDAARFMAAAEDDTETRAARKALGIEQPYILYLSRLEHPGKNHLRLLQAFARSGAARRHTLVLAGPDWGALPRIKAEIARLGLEGRVHCTGYVNGELVPGLVAGAAAVAMVGLCEGFGLPALEALAAGRPLLIARAGALPEVAGDLAATCDPFDTRSMTEALDRALLDEDLGRRARALGPERARARSWDAAAEGLLAVCRAAVS